MNVQTKTHIFVFYVWVTSYLTEISLIRFYRPLWDNRLVAEDYRVLPETPNNWVREYTTHVKTHSLFCLLSGLNMVELASLNMVVDRFAHAYWNRLFMA